MLDIKSSMSIERDASEFRKQTGKAIPESLIELYRVHGNGGFGPNYGFLGIASGHKTDLGDSILSLYQSFSSESEDDPNWVWPQELLPFLHLGCGIHLCIDTDSISYRIVEFDPTDYDPEVGPKNHFREIASSFDNWISKNV